MSDSNSSSATTTAPVVVTTADSKVVAVINTYVTALEKVDSGYNNIAKETAKVSARMGLTTQPQISDLLRLSYFEQAGLTSASDTDKAAYLDTVKSDISNLTTLVMPYPVTDGKGAAKVVLKTTEQLIAARDKAWAYNDSLPKGGRRNLRIGQKSVLAIIRGQEDVDYVIGVKTGKIKPVVAETKPTSAADTGTATPTATDTPAAGAQAAPEQQTADVPTPEGAKPVGSPRDLLRANIRNTRTVFTTVHGLSLDVVKEIIADELSKMA